MTVLTGNPPDSNPPPGPGDGKSDGGTPPPPAPSPPPAEKPTETPDASVASDYLVDTTPAYEKAQAGVEVGYGIPLGYGVPYSKSELRAMGSESMSSLHGSFQEGTFKETGIPGEQWEKVSLGANAGAIVWVGSAAMPAAGALVTFYSEARAMRAAGGAVNGTISGIVQGKPLQGVLVSAGVNAAFSYVDPFGLKGFAPIQNSLMRGGASSLVTEITKQTIAGQYNSDKLVISTAAGALFGYVMGDSSPNGLTIPTLAEGTGKGLVSGLAGGAIQAR